MHRPATVVRELLGSLGDFDWSELRYWSACGHWPFAVYIVVGAGVVLLVALLAWLTLAPALAESWRHAVARSSALAGEHSALTSQLLAGSASNISRARLHGPTAHVYQQLLTAVTMPAVVDQVRDLAATREIPVSVLQPQQTWQQHGQQAFEIVLAVQADRRQLAALLDDIGSLPMALTIRQLDWRQVSAEATLTLFLLVAEHAANSGDSQAEATVSEPAVGGRGPDPGSVHVTAPTGNDWRRVAFIKRGNRYLEVLRDAHGATRRRDGKVMEGGQ